MKQTESIKELAAALAKAQSEIKAVSKDRINPHFKNRYATLDAIMDAVRPPLAKHGLSVLQTASESTDGFAIATRLLHSSGEWVENVIPVPVGKSDAQGVGSALTYGRRYGVSALLAIATDEDDDGNAAAKPSAKKPDPKPEAKPERVAQPNHDGSLEGAMTFPFPGKGEHRGKVLGEVPIEVLVAAHDAAVTADDPKYADFIARAERVLAFHRGEK